MRVLVTGGTGFLGSHLIDLLLARGMQVSVLARPSSDLTGLRMRSVRVHIAEIGDPKATRAAVSRADAIVHAAGGGNVRGIDELYRSNTSTTRALLRAVRETRPKLSRFVLVSSLAAHGPSRDGLPVDELSQPRPVSHYGASKLNAERAVLAASDEIPVTILRPPAVYGPGDALLTELMRWVLRGVVPLVGAEGKTSLVYGPDVASAITLCLERPHASGSVFYVEDGRVYRRRELVATLADAMGMRPRVVPLPAAALSVAGLAAEAVARLADRPARLNRDKVNDLGAMNQVCDGRKLRNDLGWKPSVDFPTGVRTTVEWYAAQGIL
jgi:nucleoside-diphosphate-sugar epimerase